jgi:hypothetical protein
MAEVQWSERVCQDTKENFHFRFAPFVLELRRGISVDRSNELMLPGYDQTGITVGVYLQPTLTYIPTPGASPKYEWPRLPTCA